MACRNIWCWLVCWLAAYHRQHHCLCALDLPDEPAITPTLQIGEKRTPLGIEGSDQSHQDTAVTRQADVEPEVLEGEQVLLPVLNTALDQEEEFKSMLELLTAKEGTIRPLGYYGPEALME